MTIFFKKRSTVLLCLLFADLLKAEDLNLYRVPDEIESVGDHANGLANGGTAAVSGLASIRQNPAMLVMERMYKVNAGYHWPSQGREFYQAGIVDGTTLNGLAAGASYTSFQEDYELDWAKRKLKDQEFDSSIEKRFALGLAQPVGKISVGINGQYVQALEPDESVLTADEQYQEVKGMALGLGIAGLISPALRFGVSAENLANRSIADYAPTTYRVGLAYLMLDGQLSLHLDGVQRERVRWEIAELERDPERQGIASFSVKFYEFFRLLGAYAREFEGERESLSGGVALVNDKFTLSYTQRVPYLGYSEQHQAVNFGMAVSM